MRNCAKVRSAGAVVAGLLAAGPVLGCNHSEPASPPPYGSDTPFDATPPQRLTYNAGADRGAGWLADGAGFLYSTQLLARDDRDVCLAELPASGGSHRGLWCDVPEGVNQTDAIEFAAPGPDGRLAFLSTTGGVGSANPAREAIALAPGLDPRGATMVRTFPYTPEGSTPQDAAEGIRWLDATRLVYLGQQFRVRPPCPACAPDTLRIGQAVTLLETGTPGALPVAVPGTATATGVAVGPAGDALYYTLGGDTRVFRRTLADGTVEVAYDFGAAGIVRDIHIAGGRLAAVVGGRVAFGTDPQFGPVQWDSGGVIHVLDLASGSDTPVDPGVRLFRRPALSPSGSALVAEGRAIVVDTIFTNPTTLDTTVAGPVDLYLFGAP